MTTAKHTPGPWVLSSGTVYCTQLRGGPGYEHYETKHQVCKPPECIKTKKATAAALNWEANASLIAAAPELLAALDALLGKAYKQNFNDSYPEILELAESAIAKARGESK